MSADPHGLYVHVPFCRERCAYCDFAIVTGRAERVPEYVDAVRREMRSFAERNGPVRVDTVYFGGGTPSHVDAAWIARVIQAVRELFSVEDPLDASLEANPEDVTPDRVRSWRRAGIRRVTIGVQALTDEGLASLGRPGSAADAVRAISVARGEGVVDVGADVIFGRPGQSLRSWSDELERLVDLDVDHWSCYALETTSKTPLALAIERGRTQRPDPDRQARMYERTVRVLADAGFARYEISNFARPGHESRHNVKYWRDEPYMGFGLSAASYVGGARWTNPRRLDEYVSFAREGRPFPRVEPYDPVRRAGEAMAFGLRTEDGVDLGRVQERHGEEAVAAHRDALARGIGHGLARQTGARVTLTERGRLLADEICVHLM